MSELLPKITMSKPKPMGIHIDPFCQKCKKRIKYNQFFTGKRITKYKTVFYCWKCKQHETE